MPIWFHKMEGFTECVKFRAFPCLSKELRYVLFLFVRELRAFCASFRAAL